MKYIVDIPDGYIPYKATNERCLIFPGDPSFEIFDESKIHIAMGEKAIEKLRNEGREEAWAVARKIAGSPLAGNYNISTLREIFGDGSSMSIFESEYETVKKKIFDYENMVNVGDIVTFKDPEEYGSERAVVTFVEKATGNVCCGILYDNGSPAVFPIEDLVKTGEHVDLTDIFKKLKGE